MFGGIKNKMTTIYEIEKKIESNTATQSEIMTAVKFQIDDLRTELNLLRQKIKG